MIIIMNKDSSGYFDAITKIHKVLEEIGKRRLLNPGKLAFNQTLPRFDLGYSTVLNEIKTCRDQALVVL